MDKKETVFLIKQMSGGGAERVICMLSGEAAEKGRNTTLVLTHQTMADADLSRVAPGVEVISLPDELAKEARPVPSAKRAVLRVRSKLTKLLPGGREKQKIINYKIRNLEAVEWLKRFFAERPDAADIAFLYDSIFLTLLSAGKSNRVIISDRGDPAQSTGSRTDMAFFRYMFPKADAMVFQSPDAAAWYEEHFGIKGRVIFNPVKPDLPESFTGSAARRADPYRNSDPYCHSERSEKSPSYGATELCRSLGSARDDSVITPGYDGSDNAGNAGERRKRIVNFCRISSQKNLVLLIDAFDLFCADHPGYELFIYGDPAGNGTDGYKEIVENRIASSPNRAFIRLLPARPDIHSEILDYAMFVSSSDFEGMSNSMLEAMACGLPCVCTDCPAGGARAVIHDHENGLLTPVGNADALAARRACGHADHRRRR